MVGMLIASPIFSEMVHRVNAMRVLGIGMGIWMLAVLGSGLAWNYTSLVFFRSFVGFGEASIVSLSPPFIGKCQISFSAKTSIAIKHTFVAVSVSEMCLASMCALCALGAID